jgi:hypothetical protein
MLVLRCLQAASGLVRMIDVGGASATAELLSQEKKVKALPDGAKSDFQLQCPTSENAKHYGGPQVPVGFKDTLAMLCSWGINGGTASHVSPKQVLVDTMAYQKDFYNLMKTQFMQIYGPNGYQSLLDAFGKYPPSATAAVGINSIPSKADRCPSMEALDSADLFAAGTNLFHMLSSSFSGVGEIMENACKDWLWDDRRTHTRPAAFEAICQAQSEWDLTVEQRYQMINLAVSKFISPSDRGFTAAGGPPTTDAERKEVRKRLWTLLHATSSISGGAAFAFANGVYDAWLQRRNINIPAGFKELITGSNNNNGGGGGGTVGGQGGGGQDNNLLTYGSLYEQDDDGNYDNPMLGFYNDLSQNLHLLQGGNGNNNNQAFHFREADDGMLLANQESASGQQKKAKSRAVLNHDEEVMSEEKEAAAASPGPLAATPATPGTTVSSAGGTKPPPTSGTKNKKQRDGHKTMGAKRARAVIEALVKDSSVQAQAVKAKSFQNALAAARKNSTAAAPRFAMDTSSSGATASLSMPSVFQSGPPIALFAAATSDPVTPGRPTAVIVPAFTVRQADRTKYLRDNPNIGTASQEIAKLISEPAIHGLLAPIDLVPTPLFRLHTVKRKGYEGNNIDAMPINEKPYLMDLPSSNALNTILDVMAAMMGPFANQMTIDNAQLQLEKAREQLYEEAVKRSYKDPTTGNPITTVTDKELLALQGHMSCITTCRNTFQLIRAGNNPTLGANPTRDSVAAACKAYPVPQGAAAATISKGQSHSNGMCGLVADGITDYQLDGLSALQWMAKGSAYLGAPLTDGICARKVCLPFAPKRLQESMSTRKDFIAALEAAPSKKAQEAALAQLKQSGKQAVDAGTVFDWVANFRALKGPVTKKLLRGTNFDAKDRIIRIFSANLPSTGKPALNISWANANTGAVIKTKTISKEYDTPIKSCADMKKADALKSRPVWHNEARQCFWKVHLRSHQQGQRRSRWSHGGLLEALDRGPERGRQVHCESQHGRQRGLSQWSGIIGLGKNKKDGWEGAMDYCDQIRQES